MATIALNANRINQMPEMIKQMKQSVVDYKSELFTLNQQTITINQSICNLNEVISSIQASTQTMEEKIDSLDDLIRESEEFISDVVHIDEEVADVIKQRKDEFYEDYNYLKPECERNWIDKAKDTLSSALEWCRKHWKLIVTVVLVVAAIAIIVSTAGTALTALSALLVAVAKGVLIGAVIGGFAGGIAGVLACVVIGNSNYKRAFFEGFEDGAFGGVISGAISGGLGHILSLGGNVLTAGDLAYVGATSEFASSLIGDIGDVFVKGDDLSAEDVMINAIFSFAIGGAAGFGGHWGNERAGLTLSRINEGIGSWKHVWASQSTRSLREATKVSLKSILKGIGSKAVDDMWDHVFEAGKNFVNNLKESWNLNDKIMNGVLYDTK